MVATVNISFFCKGASGIAAKAAYAACGEPAHSDGSDSLEAYGL